MLEELKADEKIYRDSIPDITNNNIRLFYDGRLWSTILKSSVTGWKVRNLIDGPSEKKLNTSKPKTLLFLILGLIPFLGKIIRRIWCRADWQRHYTEIITNGNYFWRALSGKIIEKTVGWYRAGRINDLAGDKNRPAAVAFLLPFALFASHIRLIAPLPDRRGF